MSRGNMSKQVTEVPMPGYKSKGYRAGGMVSDETDRAMETRSIKQADRTKKFMGGGKVKGYKNGGMVMGGKKPKPCKMS